MGRCGGFSLPPAPTEPPLVILRVLVAETHQLCVKPTPFPPGLTSCWSFPTSLVVSAPRGRGVASGCLWVGCAPVPDSWHPPSARPPSCSRSGPPACQCPGGPGSHVLSWQGLPQPGLSRAHRAHVQPGPAADIPEVRIWQ